MILLDYDPIENDSRYAHRIVTESFWKGERIFLYGCPSWYEYKESGVVQLDSYDNSTLIGKLNDLLAKGKFDYKHPHLKEFDKD